MPRNEKEDMHKKHMGISQRFKNGISSDKILEKVKKTQQKWTNFGLRIIIKLLVISVKNDIPIYLCMVLQIEIGEI